MATTAQTYLPATWAQPMLIINEEPKTLQVLRCVPHGDYTYIQYKSKNKQYQYPTHQVVVVSECDPLDPKQYRIYLKGKERTDIQALKQFQYRFHAYYRVAYNDCTIGEFKDTTLIVQKLTEEDKRVNETFEYLRAVAENNELQKEDTGESLLHEYYRRINTVDPATAAYAYLSGQPRPSSTQPDVITIYPYSCNSSQKQAIENALTQTLSVIQGPPGTGKTQVILNIIANLLMRKQTVLIVSNSNYAIENIEERLAANGLSPWVAKMGKADNCNRLFECPPPLPSTLQEWLLTESAVTVTTAKLKTVLEKLDTVYALQTQAAQIKQELAQVELEWKHFQAEQNLSKPTVTAFMQIPSAQLHNWIVRLQNWTNEKRYQHKLRTIAKSLFLYYVTLFQLRSQAKRPLSVRTDPQLLDQLQAAFYQKRINELYHALFAVNERLLPYNVERLNQMRDRFSNELLRHRLATTYAVPASQQATGITRSNFTERYPIVLSTTFSARNCLPDKPYDYLIMDEASQVSIETGTLSLTCARHAVIAGDTLQLPNVITEEQANQYTPLREKYTITDAYDCARYSFLQSLLAAIPTVKTQLLREHYRCHPKIIHFCNQQFYDGQLITMTDDDTDQEPLQLYFTVEGNHRNAQNENQREIDVILEEVIPSLKPTATVGIITPYNNQANRFRAYLPHIESATVHKFQGREMDAIIYSTVADKLNAFVDDPRLLNVALSRAKKQFVMVTSGNEQPYKGNISDLIDYMRYTNCLVKQSAVSSIYDYLYSQYAEKAAALSSRIAKPSSYLSENLTYHLINDVLRSETQFHHMRVLFNYPLYQLFRPRPELSEAENRYLTRPGTHVDFLIYNQLNKTPLLGIETDGYTFHNLFTRQYQRDQMKDHIFAVNQLPLLRFSTKGSGERRRLLEALHALQRLQRPTPEKTINL